MHVCKHTCKHACKNTCKHLHNRSGIIGRLRAFIGFIVSFNKKVTNVLAYVCADRVTPSLLELLIAVKNIYSGLGLVYKETKEAEAGICFGVR